MSGKLNAWVHGCSGKTGSFTSQAFAASKEFELVGGSGRKIYSPSLNPTDTKTTSAELAKSFADCKVDIVIDFSGAEGNKLLLDALSEPSTDGPKFVLVASTGMDEETIGKWESLAKSKAVLFAPNTSIGILVMKSLLKKVIPTLSKLGFDMDVREAHHIHKLDSPSGTTKSLLEEYTKAGVAADKVDVHVERRGGVFGLHSSLFTSAFEEIEISHQAFSRKLFGDGSVMLTNWLKQQADGLYSLDDVGNSIFSDPQNI